MNIITIIETIKEVKTAIKEAEPALLQYAGTPTGDAISKLIDFASGVIEGFEDKLGGKV